jgi:TPR repeat protein
LSKACTDALAVEPDFTKPRDWDRVAAIAADACKNAADASPADHAIQRHYADALLRSTRIADAVAVLQPLAQKGDANAAYMIFDIHLTRERGIERPPVVGRAAAEGFLRQAADAGHPQAMYDIAAFSHFGGPIKRDAAAALMWATRSVEKPPQDEDRSKNLLGELLTAPDQPAANHERGLALLESLVAKDNQPARVSLAKAIRTGDKADPARARTLLEEALKAEYHDAFAPLAAMLIAGEGGTKDVARALTLLRDKRVQMNADALAALGRLHLEGRVVRREPRTAIGMMEFLASRDVDTRMQVAELLVTHTAARLHNPKGFLYYMAEAADVGEPGATMALVNLKLSRHDQLRDETAGYELAEKIADSDDRALVLVLERRSNWVQASPASRELWQPKIRDGIAKLTAKNFAPAFTLHGKLLRRGGVYPQDDVTATRALIRAAELGDVEGMVLLAKAYDDGLGTPKNAREQVRWLREAAKRGSVEARRSLLWEARFDSAKQFTLRDIVTEHIALYNDRLGNIAAHDFADSLQQSRVNDFQPKAIAQAIMDGYRIAPAGLAEDQLVAVMRRLPQQLRAEIESILKAEGHYKGDTQGYFGPEARLALAAWVDAGLGREPQTVAADQKPTQQTAAFAPAKPGQPTVADIPPVPDEAFKAYWARIVTAFKSAKSQKDFREAIRMLTVMARGGNPQARYQLVNIWDDQALAREAVTPAEITAWGIDLLISKNPNMEKARIEFVFNTGLIDRSRQMSRWVDGFIEMVRDDPRLAQEGEMTLLLKDMVFVGGACDAISDRLRSLKLVNLPDNDMCTPPMRDALLQLGKTQGPTGNALKNRIAAAKQVLQETSGEKAEASAPPAKKGKR